jgi:hypothetical protein
MGANISMDARASIVDDASLSPTPLPMLTPMLAPTPSQSPSSFEDKLRLESLLIPEDIEDIHIQATTAPAPAPAHEQDVEHDSDLSFIDAVSAKKTDTPADNTRYGKGKHWKRNLKKKQYAQGAGADASNLVPFQTERTQEQRRGQIRPIIDRLTELQMNVSYPAIRELYKQLNQFVKTGEDAKIKIPFPEFSRKIKGELSNAPYIPCWVKLEME